MVPYLGQNIWYPGQIRLFFRLILHFAMLK